MTKYIINLCLIFSLCACGNNDGDPVSREENERKIDHQSVMDDVEILNDQPKLSGGLDNTNYDNVMGILYSRQATYEDIRNALTMPMSQEQVTNIINAITPYRHNDRVRELLEVIWQEDFALNPELNSQALNSDFARVSLAALLYNPNREDNDVYKGLLLDMLKSNSEDLRRTSAINIGQAGIDNATGVLKEVIENDSEYVISGAIIGLGMLQSEDAFEILEELYVNSKLSSENKNLISNLIDSNMFH